MKRAFKIFVTAMLAAALCACAWVLSACGKEDGDTADYTVTVVCDSSPSAANVYIVQLKGEDGTTVEKQVANGKATFGGLKKGDYTVNLQPRAGFEQFAIDYVYSAVTLTAEKRDATVNLVYPEDQYAGQERISYKVKVTMPDGSPAANVSVQLCGGPALVCNFGTTDDSGVAEFELPAGDYEVHIDQKIDGCTFDNTAYKMTSSGGELEVSFKAE